MDSVAIVNALFDTKCLKFGNYMLKSGVQAPYYMNLRRLPLYPNLMSSIERLTVERYLNSTTTLAKNNASCKSHNSDGSSMDSDSASTSSDGEEENEGLSGSSSLTDNDYTRQQQNAMISSDLDPIICGVPYGAIALAKGIADKARLPLLFERKESKSYGDKQCLMDDFNEETRSATRERQSQAKEVAKQRVILIEDVICSGESILDTVQSLARRNLEVEFVICIVNREEGGVKLLFEKANIKVLSLFNISDIMKILQQSKRITSEQFDGITNWMSKNQFKSINGYPADITCEKLGLQRAN